MDTAGSVFLLFLVLGETQVGWEGEKERFFGSRSYGVK